jgi:N utilization substance protein A
MIAHALSPSRVLGVQVVDLAARSARVVVPDYQLSLAIGREGQNARLAARLTGWRIDIHSDAGAGDSPADQPDVVDVTDQPDQPDSTDVPELPEADGADAQA